MRIPEAEMGAVTLGEYNTDRLMSVMPAGGEAPLQIAGLQHKMGIAPLSRNTIRMYVGELTKRGVLTRTWIENGSHPGWGYRRTA